tara:strand:- start:1399 stop:2541 length:1143 start_codon:yes stop_codon:yes gene_type:complete
VISAADFLDPVREAGYDFFTGVPCSFLTPLINQVITDKRYRYVGASSEGEAVAIASGAWLAGRETVFMCQNSGLGNAVNALTSLNYPFRIPTLAIITWRGGPGLRDEPQHELMGRITPHLLDVIEVPHCSFPKQMAEVTDKLLEAMNTLKQSRRPFAFIMEKGDVIENKVDPATVASPVTGTVEHHQTSKTSSRFAALERLLASVPEDAGIISATGKCSRELFTIADRPQHLYQVGSMGCAVAMGLGAALNTNKPIVVIDGDGGALMKLGAFATVGACGPKNLIHVVLDNETYDSTGGQPTTSGGVDFAVIATAAGYSNGYRCDSLDGFESVMRSAFCRPGPHLIHLKIKPGSRSNLGRPTIGPDIVATRFKDFLAAVCI